MPCRISFLSLKTTLSAISEMTYSAELLGPARSPTASDGSPPYDSCLSKASLKFVERVLLVFRQKMNPALLQGSLKRSSIETSFELRSSQSESQSPKEMVSV